MERQGYQLHNTLVYFEKFIMMNSYNPNEFYQLLKHDSMTTSKLISKINIFISLKDDNAFFSFMIQEILHKHLNELRGQI